MRKFLTAQFVDRVRPTDQRREIADSAMPGLRLVIQAAPSGSKSWCLRYRHAGRSRKLTIGSPPLIDLVKARLRCKDALELISQGRDPAAEKLAAVRLQHDPALDRDAFGVAVREYVERHCKVRNRSWRQTAWLLGLRADLTCIPNGLAERWHARDINGIRRRDIIDELDRLEAAGAGLVTNRTLQVLRAMFARLVSRDGLGASPVAGVKAPVPEASRARVLSDDELARVVVACRGMAYPFGPLVELLALTGCRREEIAGGRWTEIDLVRGVWRLPATRVKNGREHSAPLSGRALEVLRGLPRFADGDFLFGRAGRAPFSGFSRAKRGLDMRSGVSDWTLHDLRRTFVTRLSDLGQPPWIVEQAVNHVSGFRAGVAGTYNRSDYGDEVRRAIELWGQHIAKITGDEPEQTPNVIEMRRGGS